MQRIWIAPLRFQKVATLTGLELNLQQFTNLKMLQRYVPSASISIHPPGFLNKKWCISPLNMFSGPVVNTSWLLWYSCPVSVCKISPANQAARTSSTNWKSSLKVTHQRSAGTRRWISMALAGSKWHGKSTSDVVKVGQSATLLVGEMRCPGRGLRVNPIFPDLLLWSVWVCFFTLLCLFVACWTQFVPSNLAVFGSPEPGKKCHRWCFKSQISWWPHRFKHRNHTGATARTCSCIGQVAIEGSQIPHRPPAVGQCSTHHVDGLGLGRCFGGFKTLVPWWTPKWLAKIIGKMRVYPNTFLWVHRLFGVYDNRFDTTRCVNIEKHLE